MSKDDRIFVRDGRKHFRRTYSITEVKIGAMIAIVLAAITAWVVWKGAHPDPELFKEAPSLVNRAPRTLDRGPIPKIAPKGWSEGEVSSFGPENLYVKIDGREGYYKSFGFQKLWFVALTNGARSIDIEVYDLGTIQNAIGAFAGEIPESATTEVRAGLIAIDRNAAFVVRGRHYLRAIGSDEEEETRTAARAVAVSFIEQAAGSEPLPWSFDLLISMGVSPAKISYFSENAFSFGFAKDVHVGLLPDGETELFVVALENEADARALADRFREGFLQYGRKLGSDGGVTWVEDQYLHRVSGARAEGPMLVGVRGASDTKSAAVLWAKLADRVKKHE